MRCSVLFDLFWKSGLLSESWHQNCIAPLDCQWHSPFCASPPTLVSGQSPKYQAQAREKPHCSSRKCHFAGAHTKIEPAVVTSAVVQNPHPKNTNLAQFSLLCLDYNKSRATKAPHCLSVIGAEKQLTWIILPEMCVRVCARVCSVASCWEEQLNKDLFLLVLWPQWNSRPVLAPCPPTFIPDVTMVKLMGGIPATRQRFWELETTVVWEW